ncbi:hypothetical protein Hamer_G000012, partial [Homarus americanus]
KHGKVEGVWLNNYIKGPAAGLLNETRTFKKAAIVSFRLDRGKLVINADMKVICKLIVTSRKISRLFNF